MEPEELKRKLKGVICPAVTPFKKNYDVDLDGLRENTEFLVENGINVLVSCGSVGEFSSLGLEEYREIVRAVVRTVDGRIPVIAGASHSGTHECIKKAKMAQEAGVDGVMTVPPYYIKPSWEGLYQHYKMLSDSLNIAVTIYNNPGFSKVNLTPENCLKLVSDMDRIVGIKETSGDIGQFYETLEICKDKSQIIMGKESLAFFGLACGCHGFISSVANFAPRLAIDLYTAFQEGRIEDARSIQHKIAPYHFLVGRLIQRGTIPYLMPVIKESMELLGMPSGPVRPPITSLSNQDKVALKAILTDWGYSKRV